MRASRFAFLIAAVTIATSCDESTVPRDQVVMNLTQVDGHALPVAVPSLQGATARITWGVIAGSPSGSTCEYRMNFTLGNSISGSEGTVTNCRPKKGENLVLKFVANVPEGVLDEHTYTWGY